MKLCGSDESIAPMTPELTPRSSAVTVSRTTKTLPSVIAHAMPIQLRAHRGLCYLVARRCCQVSPRMTPFYTWFAIMIVFLMAVSAFQVSSLEVPVPWTGVTLVALVLSVCALPLLYGRIFVRDAGLACSGSDVTPNSSNGDEFEPSQSSLSDGLVGDINMSSDPLLGERLPLLGSAGAAAGVAPDVQLEHASLTWRQCLVVSA